MANERKSVRSVRTMGALVDARRARSAAGSLLELSGMANEKLRLQKELERSTRREREIHARLDEIAAKEQRLMAVVQGRGTFASPAPAGPAVDSAPSHRVKIKEFSY